MAALRSIMSAGVTMTNSGPRTLADIALAALVRVGLVDETPDELRDVAGRLCLLLAPAVGRVEEAAIAGVEKVEQFENPHLVRAHGRHPSVWWGI
ncbi:hypothetical protein [Streptomyces sp. NBC_01014]|uniref:hypothetical protein n=1 Tax=Streptomyces sp. NBC_01014 TaxID=2903719 RepID=UPI00386E33C9|nr:hypothetical protein OG282_33845 [Streptomyces sp. NBC_01014]